MILNFVPTHVHIATQTALMNSLHAHYGSSPDVAMLVAILIMFVILALPGTIMYLFGIKKKGWDMINHSTFAGISVVSMVAIIAVSILFLGIEFIYTLIK